ncbi:MAG: aminotransferase class I/II-fold pyridoxal phosphate-dependent enzyme [Halobacteriovoraceae bacterium]|nr:aminotransferase class I/II-fold pyridoxal phosphate-dependent enzyme [Halobacteriovoraceae bacterium]MCB9094091.1 aminotransferase class I/II-fold pyridoxal phosphate-dependent enzyme [Halobacteriovoraceae bacterium]
MKLSQRISQSSKSVTMEWNEIVQDIRRQGKEVFNLTSGQLNFRPTPEFIQSLSSQLNFLGSFQYPPVKGLPVLRKKFLEYVEGQRKIDLQVHNGFDCIISNGSKHSLYNAFGSLIDAGDEVIILTPYWVSYPEMINFWGGKSVFVQTYLYDSFSPDINLILEKITDKTKAIIINSPNNPAGVHYDSDWMRSFAEAMKEHPSIYLISDEIYSDIFYYDPAPTYFYQYDESLLSRTLIINGISKSFASTGLRIGYCLAPKDIVDAMAIIQSQTTSGANSLVQRALKDFEFSNLKFFLKQVRSHLRRSSEILREAFRSHDLSHCWYQTSSAFYFMLDFSRTNLYKVFKDRYPEESDLSFKICEDILHKLHIALVPGKPFGLPNSARISLTTEEIPFEDAINKLCEYLTKPHNS